MELVVVFNLKVTSYGRMKTGTKQSSRLLAAKSYVVSFALGSKALYSLVTTPLIGCQVVILATEVYTTLLYLK